VWRRRGTAAAADPPPPPWSPSTCLVLFGTFGDQYCIYSVGLTRPEHSGDSEFAYSTAAADLDTVPTHRNMRLPLVVAIRFAVDS
jgi:hypothetical protein